MTKVTTSNTVAFGQGTVLLLSDEQAAPRRHALESLGGRRYRVATSVEFKAGERLNIEGDIPKGQRHLFVISEKAETKPAAM